MSNTPDYASECMKIEPSTNLRRIGVGLLRSQRKESCETQWESIKQRFIKWKESGQKNIVKLTVENQMGIARQIHQSDKILSELLRDGTELITNIRIANDKREVDRRLDETQIRRVLLNDLQIESDEAALKLDVITSRWLELDTFKDPMGLHEGLQLQKQRISDLMQQKNDLITELREALENSDDRYVKDQEKQSSDLWTLVERIDEQVEVMKRSYRQHLEMLQKTIDGERTQLKQNESIKWQKLYDKREADEQQSLTNAKELSIEHESQQKKLQNEHEELNRATRIRLESDNDALQIELQHVKAEIALNSEKLAYNYKVLQKRADENVIIKAQQKRRLAKLSEVIETMRNKSKLIKTNGQEQLTKLTQDVMRLHMNILELNNKMKLFSLANDDKYHNIWNINEMESIQLLDKIYEVDKCISEQHLGLIHDGEWGRDRDGQLLEKNDLRSYKKALEILNIGSQVGKGSQNNQRKSLSASTNSSTVSSVRNSTGCGSNRQLEILKLILQKITTQTQWIQDEDLEKHSILSSLKIPQQKQLVLIDHLFDALNISSMDHVLSMKKHFLPYLFCPNCSGTTLLNENQSTGSLSSSSSPSSSSSMEPPTSSSSSSSTTPVSSTSEPTPKSTLSIPRPSHFHQSPTMGKSEESIERKYSTSHLSKGSASSTSSFPLTKLKKDELQDEDQILKCKNHRLVMDSAMVAPALRAYIEDYHQIPKMDNQNDDTNVGGERDDDQEDKLEATITLKTTSRLIQSNDVELFWKQFLKIIPMHKKRMWTTLENGLNEYLIILKKRAKLDEECEFLRKQNTELKHLLLRYLPTDEVNN